MSKGETTILFETTFSFDEVLTIQTSHHNAVSHELTDLAWDRWVKAQPAAFKKYDESAYATVEAGPAGYIVTIQIYTAIM